MNFVTVAEEVGQIFSELAVLSVSGDIELSDHILVLLPTLPHVRGGKLHEYRFMTAFSLNVCVSCVCVRVRACVNMRISSFICHLVLDSIESYCMPSTG
jgi:hypothetical protein